MGAWGVQSHACDAVHDHLDKLNRMCGNTTGRGGFNSAGKITTKRFEQYLMNKFVIPIQCPEEEYKVQKALGTLRTLEELIHPRHFFGLVIWGFDRGWIFNHEILNVAHEAGIQLLNDKEEMNRWKRPQHRRYQLLKEICRVEQNIKERNDGR